MIVAVTSTVVFDVPDEGTVEELRRKFYEAHQLAIGVSMQTLTGQAYVLRAIEHLHVERREAM